MPCTQSLGRAIRGIVFSSRGQCWDQAGEWYLIWTWSLKWSNVFKLGLLFLYHTVGDYFSWILYFSELCNYFTLYLCMRLKHSFVYMMMRKIQSRFLMCWHIIVLSAWEALALLPRELLSTLPRDTESQVPLPNKMIIPKQNMAGVKGHAWVWLLL